MIGTSLDELRQFLKTNREIEFSYRNVVYTIEPGGSNEKILFSIWESQRNSDQTNCIYEYAASLNVFSDDAAIDELLNAKCFDGKSFVEIEPEVTVDVIF